MSTITSNYGRRVDAPRQNKGEDRGVDEPDTDYRYRITDEWRVRVKAELKRLGKRQNWLAEQIGQKGGSLLTNTLNKPLTKHNGRSHLVGKINKLFGWKMPPKDGTTDRLSLVESAELAANDFKEIMVESDDVAALLPPVQQRRLAHDTLGYIKKRTAELLDESKGKLT